MKSGLVLALSIAVLTACDGGDGDTSTRPHPPDEIRPALDAFCDLLERCPDFYTIGARDRGECVDILYWLFTCRFVEVGGDVVGVERVELMIDSAEAHACVDALHGLSCGDLSCVQDGTCPELDACRPLFEGFGSDDDGGDVLAEGERCYLSSTQHCATGLFCADEYYDDATESVVCNVCARVLSAGDACNPNRDDVQCGTGLGCFATDDTRTAGECRTQLADGEPCLRDEECRGGFCAGDFPDYACSSGGNAGDPCAIRSDCRWEELGADVITCVGDACGTPLEPGDACPANDACRSFHCDPSDDRCGAPAGGTCSGDYECRAGFCDDGACGPFHANGQPCTYHGACTSRYCDPATSLCANAPPRAGEGESCSSAEDCELGLGCSSVCYLPCSDDAECGDARFCEFGQCQALRANGTSCEDNAQCASQYCSNDAEVCIDQPGIGDPCAGFSDCYPRGYCSGGVCVARHGPDETCDSLDSCLEPYLCLEGQCTLISLACAPAGVGQQCTYLRFCDESSYCDYSTVTCAARLNEGEACISTFDQCGPGFYCGPSATCDAQAAEGEACAYEGQCAGGTFCVSGTCQATMSGGPCDHDDSVCPLGTFCSTDSDMCEPFRGLGEACHNPFDSFCEPDLFCESEVCVVGPGEGESCSNDNSCRPGFWCDIFNGRLCQPRIALGRECMTSPYENCIEGTYCEYDSDRSMDVCIRGIANGERCGTGSSSGCISGFCVDGTCSARGQCVLP